MAYATSKEADWERARVNFKEACLANAVETVQAFLGPRRGELGVDENFRDLETGTQPDELTRGFELALFHPKLAMILLKHLDPTVFRKGSNSPLLYSIHDKNKEFFSAALTKVTDINVNITGYNNSTAVIPAAACDDPWFLETVLQDPDVDVNRRTNYNESALAYAVGLGLVDNCRLLLDVPDIDLDLTRDCVSAGFDVSTALHLRNNLRDDHWLLKVGWWIRSWFSEEDARRLECVHMVEQARQHRSQDGAGES